jgi:hypothetical protein
VISPVTTCISCRRIEETPSPIRLMMLAINRGRTAAGRSVFGNYGDPGVLWSSHTRRNAAHAGHRPSEILNDVNGTRSILRVLSSRRTSKRSRTCDPSFWRRRLWHWRRSHSRSHTHLEIRPVQDQRVARVTTRVALERRLAAP